MKNNESISCNIVGGTGFGAGELLRLLTEHPKVKINQVISESMTGKFISEAHPQSNLKIKFTKDLNWKKINAEKNSVIFLALPHGVSVSKAKEIKENSNAKVIDLSGDLRIQDQQLHQKFYPETEFAPTLRKEFIYGLTELNTSKIMKARFIANPGCYATAAILGLAPIKNKEFVGSIAIDGKSGTSGGGKALSANFHHPVMNNNVMAYKMLNHRHEAEIALGLHSPKKLLPLQFVPHLLPISRGMMVSIYAHLKTPITEKQIQKIYQTFYQESEFIRIQNQPVEIRNVVVSNYADIFVTARHNQIAISVVIDNLVKGMAGQAIQNMNLMFGLKSHLGLLQAGLGVV